MRSAKSMGFRPVANLSVRTLWSRYLNGFSYQDFQENSLRFNGDFDRVLPPERDLPLPKTPKGTILELSDQPIWCISLLLIRLEGPHPGELARYWKQYLGFQEIVTGWEKPAPLLRVRPHQTYRVIGSREPGRADLGLHGAIGPHDVPHRLASPLDPARCRVRLGADGNAGASGYT
jgi:hypothetical protein